MYVFYCSLMSSTGGARKETIPFTPQRTCWSPKWKGKR